MRKDVIIAVALIAAGLIVYLTWRHPGDDTTNADVPQVTAPENAPAANPLPAAPEKIQPSQQN